MNLLELLEHKLAGCRVEIRDIVAREALFRQPKFLRRKRLGGKGHFARNIRLRHGQFLDGKQGLTGYAIEHEEMSHLRGLHYTIDGAAIALQSGDVDGIDYPPFSRIEELKKDSKLEAQLNPSTTHIRWTYSTGSAAHGRGVYVDAVMVTGEGGPIFDDSRRADATQFQPDKWSDVGT